MFPESIRKNTSLLCFRWEKDSPLRSKAKAHAEPRYGITIHSLCTGMNSKPVNEKIQIAILGNEFSEVSNKMFIRAATVRMVGGVYIENTHTHMHIIYKNPNSMFKAKTDTNNHCSQYITFTDAIFIGYLLYA